MTYAEAVQFLYGLRLFGAVLGLETPRKLAALAGNPQDRLRFIHVAGTNGKGSTCAMLESIYRAAGLRVGLFTSPHLVSFRERIQVNRQLISESDVVRLVEELRRIGVPPVSYFQKKNPEDGDRQEACPTFFEFVTVMALKFFADQKCDLVIWETGLGGRLDATNIVTPLAGVITNIALDHQQWLGDTLEKIAAEKAGIIKPGMPVIAATDEPEALGVIEKMARGKNAPLIKVGQASSLSPLKKIKTLETGKMPVLPLPGEHQKLNAALALAVVEVLQNQIPVSEENIRAGLQNVDWPGRLQLITRDSGQKILLDGAHNVAGAKVLREALEKNYPAKKRTLIIGALKDKDWQQICKTLAPLASRILTVPVSSERSANPNELAASCRATNPVAEVTVCASLGEALNHLHVVGIGRADPALRDLDAQQRVPTLDTPIVITGSLYLVGEALELLGLFPVNTNERGLNEWTATPSAPAG